MTQTLPSGDVIRYGYDAQGNTTAEIIDRKEANGNVVHEMTSIAYDAAGREVRRNIGAVDQNNTLAANSGNVNSVRYDAFGNIVGKQTESGNINGAAQQFTDYDDAGRIWRSNVDAGITKVYFYDRNGRPTMTLQSQTLDLRSMTLQQIQTEMSLADSQIATTITVYDERGLAIRVIQPKMTNSRPSASLMAQQGGGTFEGVQLTSGSTLVRGADANYLPQAPAAADAVAVSGNLGSFSVVTKTYIPGKNEWIGSGQDTKLMKTDFTFVIPDMTAVYGQHRIEVRIKIEGQSAEGAYKDWASAPTYPQAAALGWYYDKKDHLELVYYFDNPGTYTISQMLSSRSKTYTMDFIVKPNNGPDVQAASISHWAYWNSTVHSGSVQPAGSNQLRLSNQTLKAAASVDLYYRTAGSTGPYAKLGTSTMLGQPGTYIANVAGLRGNYDMLMVAVDKDGKLLRSDALTVNRGNNTVSRNSGVPNVGVFEGGTMHMAGLRLGNGKLATSLTYRLNNGATGNVSARSGIPGLFDIPLGVAAANLELILTAADGSTDSLIGSVNPATSMTNLQYLKYADSSLVFNNLDKNASRMELRYREEGKTDWVTKTLTRSAGSTTWVWDTQGAGLVPDRTKSYRYEMQFDAYDSDGTKVNNGNATIAAGSIAGGTYTTASITGSARPRWVGSTPTLLPPRC